MIVSPDALRKETVAVYKAVDEAAKRIEAEAKMADCSPFHVRDTNGNSVYALYASLLATKVTALNTLVMLNEPRNRTHER